MSVNENDRMVRIREACEMLGVHPITLRKWTDQGKIQAYRGEDSERGQRRYRIGDIKILMGLKIFEKPEEQYRNYCHAHFLMLNDVVCAVKG